MPERNADTLSNRQARTVRGIKIGLAVVGPESVEDGFCSLRAISFEPDGQPRATSIQLSRQEAEDVRAALSDLLTRVEYADG